MREEVTAAPAAALFRGGRRELFLLLLGTAIFCVLYWLFGSPELLATLQRPRIGDLILYLVVAVVAVVGYSLRWWMVARALDAAPAPTHLLAARLAGAAVSALVPSGQLAGEPVRIAMVSGAGIEPTRAAASVALDRMVEWVGNTLCAITYVIVFWLAQAEHTSASAPLLYLGIMLLMLTTLVMPLVMFRRGQPPITLLYRRRGAAAPDSWRARVEEMERHLVTYCQDHPRTVVQGVLLSLVIEAIVIVEYHFLLAAFGLDLTLPTLLLVLIGSGIARAVPTPGALGALEAGQVGVLALASGDTAAGFLIGVILRLHETLWMAIGLGALFWHGAPLAWWRRLRRVGATESMTPPRDIA